MRVAIVTDWMISPGGVDRMVAQLSEHFEDSEIFTSVYLPEKYVGYFERETTIRTTFLQKLSLNGKFHRHLNLFTPLAFENIDLRDFDLVISLSAGSAKGIITAPDQPHISIILTPPRTLWFDEDIKILEERGLQYKLITPYVRRYLRRWDRSAIHRADLHISISQFIRSRVQEIYNVDSEVLYPGISDKWFEKNDILNASGKIRSLIEKGSYFLVVSRLYKYKQVERAIEAVQKGSTSERLIIVGSGPDEEYLRKHESERIIFTGQMKDLDLSVLYANAKALLFCGIEDFGYVPVEAMANGCPVVAYNRGGVTESVLKGITGEFFDDQEQLDQIVTNFDPSIYDKGRIIDRAKQFSVESFYKNLDHLIATKINEI